MSATPERLQQFGDDEHARWLKERAAQEMYEALKAVVACPIDNPYRVLKATQKAITALDKAEGRS